MNTNKLKNIGIGKKNIASLVLLVSAILYCTLIKNTFFVHIGILTFMYMGLSSSWNIISGMVGQLSLGHAGYFGLGGYMAALLYTGLNVNPWIGLIIGGLFSALVAVIVGYPSLRLRGTFYTLVTIAFTQVLLLIAVNWVKLTGGSMGLHIHFKPNALNIMFESRNAYAFVFLVYALVTILISHLILRSKMGYYFIAIRENQEAAETLAISSPKYKSIAVMISAFLAGIGGALYAFYVVSVYPHDIFSTHISTMIALVAIVGGMGSIGGPIIGSLIVIPLNEILRTYLKIGNMQGVNLVIFGLVLIVVALRFPGGIYGGVKKLTEKYKYSKLRKEV